MCLGNVCALRSIMNIFFRQDKQEAQQTPCRVSLFLNVATGRKRKQKIEAFLRALSTL